VVLSAGGEEFLTILSSLAETMKLESARDGELVCAESLLERVLELESLRIPDL